MSHRLVLSLPALAVLSLLADCDSGNAAADAAVALADAAVDPGADAAPVDPTLTTAARLLDEGRHTFRYDTFGDEAFWGGALGLHRAIAGEGQGGVGPGVSPTAALALGLKVDVDALPPAVVAGLQGGTVDLDSPATTLALLQANAVVGVTGVFDGQGKLTSIGIQCALCHSTVDDSFAPGIGHRRDGWPNRDLDVGGIVAAAPDLSVVSALLGVDDATVRAVLHSWGPGKFDAEVFLDGKAFREDGRSAATLIPAAYGLLGVNQHTYTGWGSVTYWNAFVANLEMHGQGTFFDPRLDDAERFPVAAAAHSGHVTAAAGDDRITPRLGALQFYQLALEAPKPPAGSFDAAAAAPGQASYSGRARGAGCHVPPLYTEPGWNMHTPAEIGIDDFQAQRSPDQRYRTTPLAGLWARAKGGFYHDGRFATLADVVAHYADALSLDLSAAQQADLVEFLKSI
jgi:hypothetical protein